MCDPHSTRHCHRPHHIHPRIRSIFQGELASFSTSGVAHRDDGKGKKDRREKKETLIAPFTIIGIIQTLGEDGRAEGHLRRARAPSRLARLEHKKKKQAGGLAGHTNAHSTHTHTYTQHAHTHTPNTQTAHNTQHTRHSTHTTQHTTHTTRNTQHTTQHTTRRAQRTTFNTQGSHHTHTTLTTHTAQHT